MNDEFHRDLANLRAQLDASRSDLLEVVQSLRPVDLDRGRRGSWTVQRVLEHVIHSEWLYGRLVLHLRGQELAEGPAPSPPRDTNEAEQRLASTRAALLAALDGVDEETFYRLGRIGHEEYSVLSILENEASHGREHATQLRSILASG
jgi:hypothetical protein